MGNNSARGLNIRGPEGEVAVRDRIKTNEGNHP